MNEATHAQKLAEAGAIRRYRQAKERKLQCAVIVYLNMNFPQEDLPHWAVNNNISGGGQSSVIQGKMAKDMGVLAGVFDLHFLYKGIFRVIELKVPGGTISKSQREYEKNIIKHGGECYYCYSAREVHEVLKSWGLNPKYEPAIVNERSKKLMTQMAVMKELYRRD